MEIFPDEVDARIKIGTRYSEMIDAAFAKESDPARKVVTPYIAPNCTSVYAQYTVQVADRAKVEQGMKARSIPTAVHYPVPLHLQPVFANLGQGVGSFPMSEAAGNRVISLPMHPYLTEAQQAQVVAALKESVLS
jgi:UDP-2-acetamido-2-deoxy-ribo-hexuluronate aminotransferase